MSARMKGLLAGLLAAGAIILYMRAHTQSRHYTIEIHNLRFNPAVLEVAVGDTVEWKNSDMFPHSASTDSEFDTGTIPSGESQRVVIRHAGEIQYKCRLHPTMTGTLTAR
jgi:plastocyanin